MTDAQKLAEEFFKRPKIGKKEALESALYYLTLRQAFYGGLLQEINIKYDSRIPTAAMLYNKNTEEFTTMLNEEFFCRLNIEERIGILSHEILHFTHGHLFRGTAAPTDPSERMLENIAADIAINQFISTLPEGCVRIENFKTKSGQPFPLLKTFEEYLALLKESQTENKEQLKKYGMGRDGDEQGEGVFNSNDIHSWEDLSAEEKESMLKEAKKVLQRTVDKTSNSYDKMPDGIEDLIRELEKNISGLNYKRILQSVIKKTIAVADREGSWRRPNKRYGNYAPGTTVGRVARVAMYVDTSGSISHDELNQFLDVMDGFLKVGQKTCKVGLWHTDLYAVKKYRQNDRFKNSDIQSGGTDIDPVMEHISLTKPDLAIILSDFYLAEPDKLPKSKMVLICSKGGNVNSGLKDKALFIPLDKLEDKKNK